MSAISQIIRISYLPAIGLTRAAN